MIGLAAANAAGPAGDAMVRHGLFEGLNLADAVVSLQINNILRLPETTMQRLHPCRRDGALRDNQTHVEQLNELFAVLIGLGGEIAGIDPDHRHGMTRGKPAEHVQQNGRLDAEACGESKTITEVLNSPGQALRSCQRFEAITGRIEILPNQRAHHPL